MRYLARYHGVMSSDAAIYRILKRNGLKTRPRGPRLGTAHTKHYNKHVPAHHIHMDFNFMTFIENNCAEIKRFRYTAIYIVTRVRALKNNQKHIQANG